MSIEKNKNQTLNFFFRFIKMNQTKQHEKSAITVSQYSITTKETTYVLTIKPYDPTIDVWVTQQVKPSQRAYVIQAESAKYGIQRNIFIEHDIHYTYIMDNFAKALTDKDTYAYETRFYHHPLLCLKFAVDINGILGYIEIDLPQMVTIEKEYDILREKYIDLQTELELLKADYTLLKLKVRRC